MDRNTPTVPGFSARHKGQGFCIANLSSSIDVGLGRGRRDASGFMIEKRANSTNNGHDDRRSVAISLCNIPRHCKSSTCAIQYRALGAKDTPW